jgi:hypothetical protein
MRNRNRQATEIKYARPGLCTGTPSCKKIKKKIKKKVEKQTTRENGWKSYAECAGVFPDETHHNHNQRGDIGAQQVRRTQADTAN